MSLPKTVEDIMIAANVPLSVTAVKDASTYKGGGIPTGTKTVTETVTGREIVEVILHAAGIKLDTDGQTLIYPSVQGTSTPRYQLEQRNVRFRGGRK